MSDVAISSHTRSNISSINLNPPQSKFALIDPSYLKKADLQAGWDYDGAIRLITTIFIAVIVLIAAVTAAVVVFAHTASFAAAGMALATVIAIGAIFGHFTVHLK